MQQCPAQPAALDTRDGQPQPGGRWEGEPSQECLPGLGVRLAFVRAQRPTWSPTECPQGHLMPLRSQTQVLDETVGIGGYFDKTVLYILPEQLGASYLRRALAAIYIHKPSSGLSEDAYYL